MMRVVVIVMCALFLVAHAAGQEVRIVAQVNPERTYVGGEAKYIVVVEGDAVTEKPTVSFPAGLKASYAGSQFLPPATIVVNGRRMDGGPARTVYQWTLAPREAGTLVIPPAMVKVNGAVMESGEVRLAVIEAARADDVSLSVQLSRDTAYVGEPVRLTLRWVLARNPTDYQFQWWIDESEAVLLAPEDDSWLRGRSRADIPILGGIAQAAVSEELIGSETRLVVEMERILIPLQAGDLDLGTFRAIFRAPDLDAPNRMQRYSIQSEPTTLKVRPIPTAGRPANFTGLVRRRLAVLASATPTSLRVGDPLTLKLTIAADEPLDQIRPPVLARQAGFTDLFKIDTENWESLSGRAAAREFVTMLRVRSDIVDAIPPIEVCYFNPETGEFETASSQSVPLRVTPTKEITAADAIVAAPDGDDSGRNLRAALGDAAPGLLANQHGSFVLRNESTDPTSHLPAGALLAFIAAPPAVFAAVVGASWWRSPAQRARRRRTFALRRATSAIRRASGDPARIDIAFRRYVADRFDRTAEALTERDCRELLAAAGAEQSESFERVIATCESSRFGAEAGQGVPTPRVLEVLRDLDRSLKGSRA